MIRYDLSDWELEFVAAIGDSRQMANVEAGSFENKAPGVDATSIHRIGAGGEYVFHKLTGLPWVPLVTAENLAAHRRSNPFDVGPFEVRTRTKAWHDLAIHPNDKAPLYALVLAHEWPVLYFAGWCNRNFGRQDHYWMTHLPYKAWCVPQSDLLPPEDVCL